MKDFKNIFEHNEEHSPSSSSSQPSASSNNGNSATVPPTAIGSATTDLKDASTLANSGLNNYIEADQYYAFNETGNILVSTTNVDQALSEEMQQVFNEVSVFFAGMTKAITTTRKPNGNNGNPNASEYYSIYNYNALKRVIDGSGCFVQLTQETMSYESKSFGVDFSTELLSSILGIATGTGALKFATGLLSTIGKKCTNGDFDVSAGNSDDDSRVGNIVFVCQYLMGVPCISAIVSYTTVSEVKQMVKIGPCGKESHAKTKLGLNKDVYLFVTPNFIKTYSTSMDAVIQDQSYSQFVDYLQTLLTENAQIIGPIQSTTGVDLQAGGTMDRNDTYVINGDGFGASTSKGFVTLGEYNANDNSNQFNIVSWTNTAIEISAPSGMPTIASTPIFIYSPSVTLLVEGSGAYSMPAATSSTTENSTTTGTTTSSSGDTTTSTAQTAPNVDASTSDIGTAGANASTAQDATPSTQSNLASNSDASEADAASPSGPAPSSNDNNDGTPDNTGGPAPVNI